MKKYYIIFLIILLVLIVYGNSLSNPFIWDDLILIVENSQIKHLLNVFKALTSSLASDQQPVPCSGNITIYYRPIQTLAYMVDYAVFRLKPWGYHLSNILLHTICTILVYALVMLFAKDKTISLITSILFMVHPIHTEAVTYIAGRADTLAAIFFLLALIAYIKYVSSPKLKYLLFFSLSYILSLISKEVTLALPFIIILYNFCFLSKDEGFKFNKAAVACFIITAIYIVASFLLFGFQKTHLVVYKSSFLFRIITAIKAFFLYLGLLIFPRDMHMERIAPIIKSVWDISGILSVLAFLIVLALIVRMWQRSKLFFFATFWFLINFFPISGIPFRLTAIMAEHWMYIPSIGYFLVLALFLRNLEKRRVLKRDKVVLITSILTLSYSLLTMKQNTVWAKPIKFFERLIRYSPTSSKPYSNLGMLYQEKNDYLKAIQYYNKSLEIKPNDLVRNQIGLIYIETDQLQKAEELFNEILENNPQYANAYTNLGNIYIKKGRHEEAIAFFKKAIEINPQNSKFHDNLGLAYLELGDLSSAQKELELAIRLNPDNAEAYNNLGNLSSQKGLDDEAILYYQEAIQLKPDLDKAHFNLGVIYFKKGAIGQAQKEWEKVIEINPKHIGALNNLKALQSAE